MDRKKTIITIVVATVVVVLGMSFLAVGWKSFQNSAKPQDVGTTPQVQEFVAATQPLVKLGGIPKALTDIFDFGDVKPYNIQEADFPGGAKQYMLSYKTGHLRENYYDIQDEATKHGFKLQTDVSDDKKFIFTLSFAKNNDKLSASSVLGKAAGVGITTTTITTITNGNYNAVKSEEIGRGVVTMMLYTRP